MQLLLFSDLHCNEPAAQALVQQAPSADLLIGAGDFGNCRHGVEICLEILESVNKPALLVPGNAESADELRAAAKIWPTATVLHGETIELLGETFYGLGAAIPKTPFGDWSYDLSETEADAFLQSAPPGGVWICHSPPKGALDRDSRGRSLGSTAIRDAVQAKSPKLLVCGHIHASSGQVTTLGKTTIVNAGPRGMAYYFT